MSVERLQVAVAGLGRMGKRHALIWLHKVPSAKLVAVSTPDAQERQWAAQNLAPYGVTVYEDYDAMLKHPGVQAVCVASATSVHPEQAIKAIKAGYHVVCEKPLGLTVEDSQSVVDAALSRPDLKVMCGFSRRFDASYRAAHKKMTEENSIGKPTVIRAQTLDMFDPSGFFVSYSKLSGGIFVDCSIHDVDLALWFFGDEDTKVKSVYATGVIALNPQLAEYDDRDNALGLVEFYDGKILSLYSSRMGAGQEDGTEIIGTEGKITVNMVPASSFVRTYQTAKVSQEMPHDYWGRFEEAFSLEAIEFTGSILEDKPVPVPLASAVTAVKIGAALQESMLTGVKINFDESGSRIEKARL